MPSIFGYLVSCLLLTVVELLQVFGGVFALSVAMWFVSQRLRGEGAGWLGDRYYRLVAPGVACHETGHALGCIVTGTRILEFVPFRPEGNRLGYVSHEGRAGFFGQIAEFVIGTGPVWFGSAVILILARLLAGPDFLPSFDALMPYRGESGPAYLRGVWSGAEWMALTVFSPGRWTTPLFPVFLYLMFCVASEITLSPVDIASAWRGFVSLAALLGLLNFVPFVSDALAAAVDSLRPALFVLHSILLFVLFVDAAFLAAVRLVRPVFRRRR
jgi:hypothetical protein